MDSLPLGSGSQICRADCRPKNPRLKLIPPLFDQDNPPKTIVVRVIPKAKIEQIKADGTDESVNVIYKIHIRAAPEDGKANKAVIKLLAKELGVPKSSLSITKGETSRNKIITRS